MRRQAARPAPRSPMSRPPTGLTVQTTFGLKRAGNRQRRCRRASVDAVFRDRRRTAPAAPKATSPAERVVFHVTDITVPAFDAASPEGKRIDGHDAPLAHRGPARRNTSSALQTDLGATINHGGAAPGRRRGSDRPELMQIEPAAEALRGALRARRAAGGVDHAGRRSRNAGLGVPQGRGRASR